MAQQVNIQDTLTLHPTSFDDDSSSYASANSSYPYTNAFTDASSTTYAQFNITTGSSANTYLYFYFNTSEIPSGATISSVTCSAKAYINTTNSSRITTRQIQLCSGTTVKGSASTISNSTSAFTMTPGTWTYSELQNIGIRIHIQRGTSNTTSTYYVRFYGATLNITYAIQGMQYTITATSEVDGASADPLAQNVMEGEDATISIYANSLNDISVKDNDIEINDSLIQHTTPTGGTLSKAPASYTVSGSVSGTRYQHTVGCTVDDPSSQTGNDYCSSNGSTATIYYHFDFSDIPDNATINSMTVQAYGHLENSSQSSEVAHLNTYSGTTAKGTQVSYTSTSSQLITITPGTWTVAELKDDPRVGFTIGYYGGLTTGITWSVTYSIPSTGNPYYWTYTLTNVAADHAITIEQSGPFEPPEEDPEYTYYPITISSINAVTSPHNGTTRVVAGTNQTITITPTDPQLTLALDNGVDITSQLVGGVPNNTYTVDTQVSGADYGFNLNSSTGYYVSTNDGVNKSASVARLNLDLESNCLVTIQYINSAEANYDYGMFGKLDTAVATDGLTAGSSSSSPSDSTSNYELAMARSGNDEQTITYSVPSGEHFIDIKYGKDDGSNSDNDSLQWKVLSIEATSAGGDYTYTLTNVQAKHSLIFIFGNVSYYFITSEGTGARLYPDGQTVKLAGDSYSITIIPDNINATVTIRDNNTDISSSLVRLSGVNKNNEPIVNYTYSLTNIAAAHNLVISCGTSSQLFIKQNNSWVAVTKAFQKIDDRWVEVSNITTLFNNSTNYLKG